jgi:hypothetical protein
MYTRIYVGLFEREMLDKKFWVPDMEKQRTGEKIKWRKPSYVSVPAAITMWFNRGKKNYAENVPEVWNKVHVQKNLMVDFQEVFLVYRGAGIAQSV